MPHDHYVVGRSYECAVYRLFLYGPVALAGISRYDIADDAMSRKPQAYSSRNELLSTRDFLLSQLRRR